MGALYGWWDNIDAVAKQINESWDNVFKMPVIAFFNLLGYIRHKNNQRMEERRGNGAIQ